MSSIKRNLIIKRALLYILLFAVPLLTAHFWHLNFLARKAADSANITVEAGRLAGLAGVYCLMLQVLLVGRVSWIERLFGLDRLTIAHHIIGLLTLPLLCAHPLLLATGYGRDFGNPLFQQYKELLTWDSVVPASYGLIALFAIVFLSLGAIRKRLGYEIWYGIHVLALAAIALSFNHQFRTGNDLLDSPALTRLWYFLYAFTFGNLVIYHILKPLVNYLRHAFKVEKVEREADDVVSVYIGGRNMAGFRFEPGQFVIVRFLARGFISEAHPFSLSSCGADGLLRITVKSSGGFTSRLSRLAAGTKVIIDGPHGVFTATFSSLEKILLIAGGIGITPIRAIAEKFLQQGRDVTLLYSCRKKGGIVFCSELDEMRESRGLKLTYVISDSSEPGDEKGRIDSEKLGRLVPDASERDIYICGPVPMMMGLVKLLASQGVKRGRLHYERFSL